MDAIRKRALVKIHDSNGKLVISMLSPEGTNQRYISECVSQAAASARYNTQAYIKNLIEKGFVQFAEEVSIQLPNAAESRLTTLKAI